MVTGDVRLPLSQEYELEAVKSGNMKKSHLEGPVEGGASDSSHYVYHRWRLTRAQDLGQLLTLIPLAPQSLTYLDSKAHRNF